MPAAPPLSLCHRLWFVFTALGSLALLALTPPFQTNDEPSHWFRAWSATTLVCKTMPSAALSLVDAVDYAAVREHRHRFSLETLRAGWRLTGNPAATRATGTCMYSPVAYLLPALAMHAVASPYRADRRGGMLSAFYVARFANWLLMAIAVYLFLGAAPGARTLALTLYSVPMTMHQIISINQDAMIFALMFATLALWWLPQTPRRWLWLLGAITLLSLTKVVYLMLLPLSLLSLARLRAAAPWLSRRRLAALGALVALPLALFAAWNYFVAAAAEHAFLQPDTDPVAQLHFLRAHPAHLVRLGISQLADFAGRGHMNGGWTGLLGVFGWADFEIGNLAYVCLWLAIPLACAADLGGPPSPDVQPLGRHHFDRWALRVTPLVCVLALVPAICLVTYFTFSVVGSRYIIGVHARYFLSVYFPLLMLLVYWARGRFTRSPAIDWLRRHRGQLEWATFVLCAVAAVEALRVTALVYYGPGSG